MFTHSYFPAFYFAPGYFPPVVAAAVAPGVYDSDGEYVRQERRRKKRQVKRKNRQEREEILFWLAIDEMMDDDTD